jgi:hypothetical protein
MKKYSPEEFDQSLRNLYMARLKNQIEDVKFVDKFQDAIVAASNQRNLLTSNSTPILKLVAHKYIDLLCSYDETQRITIDNIKGLAAIMAENWCSTEYQLKISDMISSTRSKALKLQFGDLKLCEKLIMAIDKFFSPTISIELDIGDNKFLLSSGFLSAAKQKFDKIEGKLSAKAKKGLLSDFFLSALTTQDIKYLARLVDEFSIDLKTFSIFLIDNQQLTPLGLLPYIWYQSSEKVNMSAKDYLEFLVKKHKLHPDSDQSRADFSVYNSMTALLMSCNVGNREVTELLLQYGADVNQLIRAKNLFSQSVVFRTPFSVSCGSGDIDFVRYLVSQKADPLKCPEALKELVGYTEPNLRIFPTMGKSELPLDKAHMFLPQYYELIELAYLERIESFIQKGREELLSEDRNETAVDSLLSQPTQKHMLADTKTKKIIDQYIFFKSQKTTKDIRDELDILLIEYLRDRSEGQLATIHDHINNHPELHYYIVSNLLKSIDNLTDAGDILMYHPNLLHQFCSLKKREMGSKATQSQDIGDLPKGVYEVQSELKHKVYVSISEDLRAQLRDGEVEKFETLLSQGCKFIQASSLGISGIKTHGSVIKLKLAHQDKSIATNTRYIDKSTGTILIVFDRELSHKDDIVKSRQVTTRTVENLKDLWKLAAPNSQVYEQGLSQLLDDEGFHHNSQELDNFKAAGNVTDHFAWE